MAEMRSIHVLVPREHPSFAGHFPGAPLLPGVVLLSEVLEALLSQAPSAFRLSGSARLGAVKFLAPVRPGASLEIRFEAPGPGQRLRFEVWRQGEGDAVEGVLAASGQIEAGDGVP